MRRVVGLAEYTAPNQGSRPFGNHRDRQVAKSDPCGNTPTPSREAIHRREPIPWREAIYQPNAMRWREAQTNAMRWRETIHQPAVVHLRVATPGTLCFTALTTRRRWTVRGCFSAGAGVSVEEQAAELIRYQNSQRLNGAPPVPRHINRLRTSDAKVARLNPAISIQPGNC